jgi:hypothetical protein
LTGGVFKVVNGQPVAVDAATLGLTPANAPSAPPLTTTTNAAGAYTFLNVQQGTYNLLVQKFGFDDFRGTVTITAGQITALNITLNPRPVDLVITWNPNPTSVNAADPDCDGNPNTFGPYCWQSNILFTERSGTAFTFTSVTLHFFDAAGASTGSVPGTWAPLPETVPGGGTLSGSGRITSSSPAGQFVEFEFTGTDPFGQRLSVRSQRLGLNTFIVIGLSSSDRTVGTAVIQTGGGQSGGSPIRRR